MDIWVPYVQDFFFPGGEDADGDVRGRDSQCAGPCDPRGLDVGRPSPHVSRPRDQDWTLEARGAVPALPRGHDGVPHPPGVAPLDRGAPDLAADRHCQQDEARGHGHPGHPVGMDRARRAHCSGGADLGLCPPRMAGRGFCRTQSLHPDERVHRGDPRTVCGQDT